MLRYASRNLVIEYDPIRKENRNSTVNVTENPNYAITAGKTKEKNTISSSFSIDLLIYGLITVGIIGSLILVGYVIRLIIKFILKKKEKQKGPSLDSLFATQFEDFEPENYKRKKDSSQKKSLCKSEGGSVNDDSSKTTGERSGKTDEIKATEKADTKENVTNFSQEDTETKISDLPKYKKWLEENFNYKKDLRRKSSHFKSNIYIKN